MSNGLMRTWHFLAKQWIPILVFLVGVMAPCQMVGQRIVEYDSASAAQAEALSRKALELMGSDQFDAAIVQWKKALDLVPGYAPFQYEMALTYVMSKSYAKALSTLLPIYTDDRLFDRGYQLMGNIHDLMGDSAKSKPYYEAGLKRHPQSGRLHYEMGAAAMVAGNVDDAIRWWKKGTIAEPSYSTTYYWLARTYSRRPDRIWAAFYAEAFLNLDRGSERTKEISKLIYDVWNDGIRFGHDSDPIMFCSEDLLNIPSPGGPNVMSFPVAFEFTVATAGQHLIPEKGVKDTLSLAELVDLRTRFLRSWKAAGYDTLYPNSVISWQQKILASGWIKEYLYWLNSFGDRRSMTQYYTKNDQRYDTFLAWFGQNIIPTDTPLCLDLDCQKQ